MLVAMAMKELSELKLTELIAYLAKFDELSIFVILFFKMYFISDLNITFKNQLANDLENQPQV